MIVVPAERARDFANKPAMGAGLRAGLRSSQRRAGAQHAELSQFAFRSARASVVYDMAKLRPADMGIVQCYENFTGGVLMSLVEHGLGTPRGSQRIPGAWRIFMRPIAHTPLNTSGGNLAECCYVHGLELVNEAVRC